MVEIEIRKVKLSEIRPNPDNPRTISAREMELLTKSLQEFPDMAAIREVVVDETMMILGGNMRYRAMKKLKEKECRVKVVTGLTPEQKREFIIKDNAYFGEWNMDTLANIWSDLPLSDWGLESLKDWLESSSEEKETERIDGKVDQTLQQECPNCGFKW